MRLRNLLLVGVLGFTAAALPALASSETTPTVEAVSTGSGGPYGYETFAWKGSGASIASGGSVAFVNNSSTIEHGIIWTSAVKPTCSAGVPVGETKFGTHWSGSCMFSQPGTYTFECSVHRSAMTGTITVTAAGVTTTTMTTTPTPTTSSPTPTSTTPSPTPKPKPSSPSHSTRAKKLAKALKACKRLPKAKRAACIKRAHKRYGPKKKKK